METPTWIATACGLAMTRNGRFCNFYLPYRSFVQRCLGEKGFDVIGWN
ncbi:MAG: hypothetical protein Q8K05_09555 [Polaromonas sp.]|nr:hypothetical protein [Polaromonas sp.]